MRKGPCILILCDIFLVAANVAYNVIFTLYLEDLFELFKQILLLKLLLEPLQQNNQIVLCIFLVLAYGKLFWTVLLQVVD